MTTATLPLHPCVGCRELPERPFDRADVVKGKRYRPRKPAEIVSGKTKASFRCRVCTRDKAKADSLRVRTKDKATRFGVSRELQIILWAFQGKSCPCGRKHGEQIPPGVSLDHDHSQPCVGRDHAKNRGCLSCVTGFLCAHCNRDIIGRLEKACRNDRQRVGISLLGLYSHLTDPPLARLLAERPDLLETAA